MLLSKNKVISFFALFFIFVSSECFSFGDLTVTPTRVIFEGRDRAKTITLVNRGAETSTFRIEFAEMAMDDYGGINEIDQPAEGQQFSSQLVKYAPRQVTIPPGGSQTVRLIVRKPGGLSEGEYRSHLVMYAVPDSDQNAVSLDKFSDLKEKEVGFQVSAIFRVAIPVIVREGDLDATFNISDVKVNNLETLKFPISPELVPGGEAGPNLTFDLSRTGDRSVYANVDVMYKDKNKPNSEYLIGSIRDYVVYVPNSHRYTQVPLTFPSDLNGLNGSIDVIFYKSNDGEKEILAKSSIEI